MKVSILGAASYAGGELLRILINHGDAEICHLTGTHYAGEPVTKIFPYLEGFLERRIESVAEPEALAQVIADSDLLFLILPHGAAAAVAQQALTAGKKVIDIGADFRFADPATYAEWYGLSHPTPELLAEAVYGLPELFREQISEARLVGNPGCYPTASILGLAPLLQAGLIKQHSIIIDAKSGISGAGRTPKSGNIYSEAAQSFKAYGVANHRHTPEIERILGIVGGKPQLINFTPHLTPMIRGIHATIYAELLEPLDGEALTELYQREYGAEYFLRVHEHGEWPQSKWATGSNFCHMAVTSDPRTGRVIICSVIDNLVKGAAGQAVQNLNIMYQLPEQQGLTMLPMVP